MLIVSRNGLDELVWQEPNKNVAPKFGISDVALAKICRKHSIPRPHIGYWAVLTAEKSVNQKILPRRGIGVPREIELDRKKK